MRALLIPTAVLMPREMRRKFGDLPTGLFPLENRPMLDRICEKYRESVDRMYAVTFEKHENVEKYVRAKKLPIECIKLDSLNDLGYTVFYGIREIARRNKGLQYLYINFADSLIDDDLPNGENDFSYYSEQDMDDSWTYFCESGGHIERIFDKGNFRCGEIPGKEFRKIFVGSFGVSRPEKFMEMIRSSGEDEKIDTFYQAMLSYSRKYSWSFLPAFKWFDVGHDANYVKAKTEIAARSFNFIDIDEARGTLVKRSESKAKLIDEIQWYLRMPKQLRYMLPRIYDYSLEFDAPFVKMEYYGYHTLHSCFLYGDLPVSRWRKIFSKLLFVMEDMGTFRLQGRQKEAGAAVLSMYLEKTRLRLDELRGDERFSAFYGNPLVINGKPCHSIDRILELLPGMVSDLLLPHAEEHFSIIHGDLCFANILVEDTYNFVRLIDPRGRFGAFDIYGDSRYELAKLLHSLEGHYDHIIEDMFDICLDGNTVSYKVQEWKPEIREVFYEVFHDRLADLQAIRLIEATLFLSMASLHRDSLNRQYAMLATGMQIFGSVYEEAGYLGSVS